MQGTSSNKYNGLHFPSASNNRLTMLQQQEQLTYKAFDLQNFYQNKKLNILTLKDRIQKFKAFKLNSTKNTNNPSLQSSNNNLKKHQPKRSFIENRQLLQGHQKLQRIDVAQPKNQRGMKMLDNEVERDFINLNDGNNTSNVRNKLKSQILNRNSNCQQGRQKKAQSKFQTYFPESNNPEKQYFKKNNSLKRKASPKNLQEKEIVIQNPKSYHFKIQPIKTLFNKNKNLNKTRYQEGGFKNKSTEKSYSMSEKQSRVSYNFIQTNPKIQVNSQYDLDRLQSLISRLWSLYELLTQTMLHVQDWPFTSQQLMEKYVSLVCEDTFQYIKQVLDIAKLNRLNRAFKMAKLLQNLSIVYLAMEVTKKKKIKQSHIVNFIGYCTSNIIFFIKILYLFHDLNPQDKFVSLSSKQVEAKEEGDTSNTKETSQKPKGKQPNMNEISYQNKAANTQTKKICYSRHTIGIIATIKKFQVQSYKQELKSILDVIIRMEHNNEIINIVQMKLCSLNRKDFQTVVAEFLRSALRDDSEPLFSYARYIFQFLAFQIAKDKLYGSLKSLQIAPQPYLNLKFPFTVVIEPYAVLVYQNKSNILIRAQAQTFISSLAECCNVVLWSAMMPQEIDPILQLFPKKQNIFYLYRYHCIYDNQLNRFTKPLRRIGSKLQNIMIIDSSMQTFENQKSSGIQFPWRGERKDTKLMKLFNILQPFFSKNCSLKKSLSESRPQINSLMDKKKHLNFRSKFRSIDQDDRQTYGQINKFNNQIPIEKRLQPEEDHLQLPTMMAKLQVYKNQESLYDSQTSKQCL